MEDIGSVLKAAREARKLSLSDISKRISIDVATLNKLEENRFDEIAAPVFIRGYLKLYAQQLALPETQIEGILAHSFGHHPDLHLSEANIESQRKSFRRNHMASWLLLLLLLAALLTLAFQLLNRESWLMRQIRATFPAQEMQHERVAQNPIQLNTTAVASPETPAMPAVPPIILESAQGSASEGSAEASAATGTSEDVAPEATISAEEAAADAEMPVVMVMQPSIQLRLRGETWLQITDKNKKRIASGTYAAGKQFDLDPANAPYEFNIGRAEQVQLYLNEREANLKQHAVPNTKARYKVSL